MAGSRPFGVTLVAVIAWITGALQVISGVFALFGGNVTLGVVGIVVGIITVLVSLGLFSGNSGARLIVTIVFLLNIGGSIYLLIAHPGQVWSAIGSLILPLIGLILLYTSRANAFFK